MRGAANGTAGRRRPVAWHLGRRGEVAGGMTQVVNGYLAWPFETFDQRVIVSRDGSHGPRAVGLVLSALRGVLALRPRGGDLVIAHLSQGGSFVREGMLLRLAHARGLPTVVQLHGSTFAAFAARRPRLVARTLRAATRVLALSEESADVARSIVGESRVVLLPNAVAAGTPTAKERTVVFGGSVSHRKGVDVLLEAWRRSGAGRGWRLLVAGPVADADVVRGALPDVELLGAVDHADLMGLLDRSSVAVLPSRDEAMPMFLLEALARENAVIGTRVGGVPALLSDGAGLVLEPGDVDALAAALDLLLGDDGVRERLARAGSRRFRAEFSASAVYPRLERVWADALGLPVRQDAL